VKTRGLTKDRINLLGRHPVIDNKVETDRGQRRGKLLGSAVNCPRRIENTGPGD
jgi:hypothetical protein